MEIKKKIDVAGLFFKISTIITILVILFIIGFIFYIASPVLYKEGLGFIFNLKWDYSSSTFGSAVFIIGTIILTVLTLIIAVPTSLFTAIFLSEWAPLWLEKIIRPMIELLVGIPSVVYGIVGIFIFEGFFRNYVDPTISSLFGFIPFLYDNHPETGTGLLLTSFVLALMIVPTIISLSQEAMKAVSDEHREASFALGATKWETIRNVVVPIASTGIIAAIILGIMRAMGETMAVVMIIGNSPKIPATIFDHCYPMTSKILNEIGYQIAFDEPRSALFAIAAILFLIEICFVALVRLIYWKGKGNHDA